jgi:hypothetical protein
VHDDAPSSAPTLEELRVALEARVALVRSMVGKLQLVFLEGVGRCSLLEVVKSVETAQVLRARNERYTLGLAQRDCVGRGSRPASTEEQRQKEQRRS